MTSETAVALRPSGQLAITDDQDYWTPEQYAGLKAIGIKGATEGDLAVYFHYCRRTMLDPFSRQIYMIQRRVNERYQDDRGQWQDNWVSKQTIQVGIDGFRVVRDRVAVRTNCEVEFEDTVWYDAGGTEHAVWLRDDAPAACRVVLVKHSNETGRALRYPAVLRMASYIQTDKKGSPTGQWRTQAEHMLEKCCEAFATRRAFPNDFSGVYLEEEMQGNREGAGLPEVRQSRKVTAGQILRTETPADNSAAGEGGESAEAAPEAPGDGIEPATASAVNGHYRRLGFTAADVSDVLRSALVIADRDEPISAIAELDDGELVRVADALSKCGNREDLAARLAQIEESQGAPADESMAAAGASA